MASGAASTATYGGSSMTEEYDFEYSHDSNLRTSGYSLSGIASSSQTVTATASGSPDRQAIGVISMSGVDQSTPVGTAVTGSSDSVEPSVTAGSVGTDDLVVSGLWSYADSHTTGANQTERLIESFTGGFEADFMMDTQAGSDGGVMSSTTVAGALRPWWGMGTIAFKPSTAVTRRKWKF